MTGSLTKGRINKLSDGLHSDGAGLYLSVKGGGRSWVWKGRVKGAVTAPNPDKGIQGGQPKRVELGLGPYPVIGLPEAREKALECKRLARQGIDPRKKRARAIPTFAELAAQVHAEHLPTWKNAKHGQQFINTLKDYAFPIIGSIPVSDISQNDVLRVLSPIWVSKPETAKRVMQRIGTVMNGAKARELFHGSNPVDELKASKALPRVKAKPKHHASMPYSDLPDFYAALCKQKGTAAKALRWTILTAVRTGETLGAVWDEIDQENGLWAIPASRMKADRDHRVPLTEAALEYLGEPDPKCDFIFEGQKRSKPLSNMSMATVLRRMEVEGVTVHGFRSTFRVWAAERANVPREVAEAALAHTLGDKVEQAYQRSDFLEARRDLMQRWADFVTGTEVKVVRLHG